MFHTRKTESEPQWNFGILKIYSGILYPKKLAFSSFKVCKSTNDKVLRERANKVQSSWLNHYNVFYSIDSNLQCRKMFLTSHAFYHPLRNALLWCNFIDKHIHLIKEKFLFWVMGYFSYFYSTISFSFFLFYKSFFIL